VRVSASVRVEGPTVVSKRRSRTFTMHGNSSALSNDQPPTLLLFKKTYQFINVVNGVSHSHKTANIFFSFDSEAEPVNWHVYIGLRDAITRQFT